jgi:hypothetical protein
MATPAWGDTEFVLGYCPECAKQVLTHLDLDPGDEELRRCLHCDAIVTDGLSWATGDDLEASGYALLEARTCGNGGGCAAGCGVRSRR